MSQLLTISFIVTISIAWAQKPLVLNGKLSSAQLNIENHTLFYEDLSGDTLSLDKIKSNPFLPFHLKPDERSNSPKLSRRIIWLKFLIGNSHTEDTLKLFHETGMHNLITTYEDDHAINWTGQARPGGLTKSSRPSRPYRFETLLSIPPQQTNTYYVRVIDYHMSVISVRSVVTDPQANMAINYEIAMVHQPLFMIMSILLGCLIFMSLYALYSFLLTRDKAFLYYFLYTFTSSLICFHSIDHRFGMNWFFHYYTTLNSYYPAPLHPALISIFYGFFLLEVVERRMRPFRHNFFIFLLFSVLALQQALSMIEAYRGSPVFTDNTIYRYGLLPASVLTVVMLITVTRSKAPIKNYLIAGLSSLLCFTILPMLVNFRVLNLSIVADSFVNLFPFWMLLGLSIEAFCFAMALVYRGKLIELTNTKILESYSRDLEAQLAEQTKEIQNQSRQIETQHIRQIEMEFERKLAGSEMMALRSQMNPHFIFNSLNSIKFYTLQNDSIQASEYLTKFARLIRLVLENSQLELVTLKNELEALQLYIELEAMRFKEKLSFIIDVSPEVDVQYVRIPPMVLQPYVENSIWHGLMHKPEGGRVMIHIRHSSESLIIEIADDGIGRARAAELKSKSGDNHKSLGLQVTAERIRMINQRFDTNTQIQIVDLVDSFGQPCGTSVVLKIPNS